MVDLDGSPVEQACSGDRQARAAVLGYATIVALFVAALLGREPIDDSHFFKRIGRNFVEHGTFAWNVGEPPLHGNTSQLFQLVATGVVALSDDHYVLAMRLLLAGCLVLAAAWAARGAAGAELAAVVYAYASPVALYTVLTGMETAVTLAVLSGFLALWHASPRRLRHGSTAPLAAVLVYLVRPDACLLALGPLLVQRWQTWKKPPLRELLVFGIALGACLAVLRIYYGSALPIPFYAKTGAVTPYDARLVEAWLPEKRSHLGLIAVVGFPLAAAALRCRDRKNLALLASALVFVAYHAASTLEINGNYARFYAPVLPVLVLAARRGIAAEAWPARRTAPVVAFFLAGTALLVLTRQVPNSHRWFASALPELVYLHLGVAGALVIRASRGAPRIPLAVTAALALAVVHGREAPALEALSDEGFLSSYQRRLSAYRGITPLRACLGDAIHVYHSEIGVPGVMFRNGKITDLAGLFTPELLYHPDRFESRCRHDRPEAIFLPEPNSNSIRPRVEASACLADEYVRVVGDSRCPLHVRRDLVLAYRRCEAAPPGGGLP